MLAEAFTRFSSLAFLAYARYFLPAAISWRFDGVDVSRLRRERLRHCCRFCSDDDIIDAAIIVYCMQLILRMPRHRDAEKRCHFRRGDGDIIYRGFD